MSRCLIVCNHQLRLGQGVNTHGTGRTEDINDEAVFEGNHTVGAVGGQVDEAAALHEHLACLMAERPPYSPRNDEGDLLIDMLGNGHMASCLKHDVSNEHMLAFKLAPKEEWHRIVFRKSGYL